MNYRLRLFLQAAAVRGMREGLEMEDFSRRPGAIRELNQN
jgi:hypothetical protein